VLSSAITAKSNLKGRPFELNKPGKEYSSTKFSPAYSNISWIFTSPLEANILFPP
jgi:hypothetical protein